MPTKPLGPCSKAGCPARAVRRGLCAIHADESEARYRKTHPDVRPSASERGYDVKWRRIRAAFLKKHPICEDASGCRERATDVDHMLPRTQGGTDDWSNLMALCHPHHSRKTGMYDGAFGNPKRAVAGR